MGETAPHPVNLLEQKALAAFMGSGEYERHLRRMKRIYSRKFSFLMQLLRSELNSLFDWTESDAGLHIFGWRRGSEEDYVIFRERCWQAGIRWSETYVLKQGVLKYGAYVYFVHLSEREIEIGVERMRRIAEGM